MSNNIEKRVSELRSINPNVDFARLSKNIIISSPQNRPMSSNPFLNFGIAFSGVAASLIFAFLFYSNNTVNAQSITGITASEKEAAELNLDNKNIISDVSSIEQSSAKTIVALNEASDINSNNKEHSVIDTKKSNEQIDSLLNEATL